MLQRWLAERKRRQLRSKVSHPAMQAFLAASPPAPEQLVSDTGLLALDLEMSGLDASQDQIVSIGYVAVADDQVIMRSAVHQYVCETEVDLANTAPIHNIRNQDLEDGRSLEAVLGEMLAALQGKVLVLHHAPLDSAFLNQACLALYGCELLTPTIDTLSLERRLRRHDTLPASAFRLHACRSRYGLPAYTAHNALTDAIATAELWVAQLSHSSAGKPVRIRDYI